MLTLKESFSKAIIKKADFQEIESLLTALSNKADQDVISNQMSELKSLLLSKMTKLWKDGSEAQQQEI